MIEDLMKLKNQIDTMIETYKDLHPETYFEYSEKTKKSLNMSLELQRTTGAAVACVVDAWLLCDAIFYINLDGTASVSV